MNPKLSRRGMELGFTLVEVLIVVLILIVLVAIAVPNYLTVQKSLRIAGDCRSIAGLIAEAKLRAAADYTHAACLRESQRQHLPP